MADTMQFEYEGLDVSISYDPSNNSVKRTISDKGIEVCQDELSFDKSLVANFGLMSAEEQAKIANAWGAAGIKTRIDDGQFDPKE